MSSVSQLADEFGQFCIDGKQVNLSSSFHLAETGEKEDCFQS